MDSAIVYKLLTENIEGISALKDEPMKKHTSFRIGGPADVFVEPDKKQLPLVLSICREHSIPITVLGNGSNVLVGDKGIRGVCLCIGKRLGEITGEGNKITAGAGAIMSAVSSFACENELSGFEFASGIPGSIGGALFMNAGAYGGEMKDVVVKAETIGSDGVTTTYMPEEMSLSYRTSAFKDKGDIITEVTLLLVPGSKKEISGKIEKLAEMRREKQPLEYPSAGSTFKRPEGYFAGKLIMDAGLKGFSVGDACVSEKHAGFVINKGRATAKDVRSLVDQVRDEVKKQFGVTLEPEIKFVGEF